MMVHAKPSTIEAALPGPRAAVVRSAGWTLAAAPDRAPDFVVRLLIRTLLDARRAVLP
jgi:hypothetical protein